MSLGPLTRKDITDVLLSKFVPERFGGIEIGCKGRMLKKLVEAHEFLGPVVAAQIVKR